MNAICFKSVVGVVVECAYSKKSFNGGKKNTNKNSRDLQMN